MITKKKSIADLTKIFQRDGYVRYQNITRLNFEGGQKYKKGNEVRLIAHSKEELNQILELLHILDFKSGKPFEKDLQIRIPIYGIKQTERFLEIVNHLP